jgi:hypothetical protein
MVFNTTFNNISVISWQSVLLVEETGIPGENHRPVASHWQTLSHNVVSRTPCHERVQTHNFSGDRHLIARGLLRIIWINLYFTTSSNHESIMNETKVIILETIHLTILHIFKWHNSGVVHVHVIIEILHGDLP